MTCADCTHWNLRGKLTEQRQMASLHYGLCKLQTGWTFFAPTHTCPKHAKAEPAIVEARAKWLSAKRGAVT